MYGIVEVCTSVADVSFPCPVMSGSFRLPDPYDKSTLLTGHFDHSHEPIVEPLFVETKD